MIGCLTECGTIDAGKIRDGNAAATIGKLRQDLSSSQHVQAMTAEQVRKLEVNKISLEMDKEVLEKKNVDLQKQLEAEREWWW